MQAESSEITIEAKLAGLKDHKLKFDAQRLQQVLSNLLSNAIKFSKAEAKVTVTGQVQMRS